MRLLQIHVWLHIHRSSRRGSLAGWRRWLCCGLCVLGLTGRAQSASSAYQTEAADLCNFAKFVSWPAARFTNSEAPLLIGIYGRNPFGHQLQTLAAGHRINGRPVVVETVATPAAARRVHLLYFSAAEDPHVAATLAALKGAGVLTVGESPKFLASGGVIHFTHDADRIRFEINLAAADRQGVRISSQLLKLSAAAPRGR